MNKTEKITLAGGCFWCTEAIYKRLKGVISVVPGYSGGSVSNPTYEQVSSGTTGHAEAVEVEYDPKEVSLEKILEVFFTTHDPTTINRQGNDVGTQYRSVIFYRDEAQKEVAESSKAKYAGVVTEIVPFSKFYPAEDYHKNYFENHREAPYCQVVIEPKIAKFEAKYGTKSGG